MGVLRVVPSYMCYVACHRFHRTVRSEGIDFIISSSIRNYFGSNLCRPFALGLWISYRGRPSRIMARRQLLTAEEARELGRWILMMMTGCGSG